MLHTTAPLYAPSRPRALLGCWLAVLLLGACANQNATATLTEGASLSAAASLRTVLPPLVEAFEQQGDSARITVNYGASGALRQQVQLGAPVDAVLFASEQDVDLLIQGGFVDQTTRKVVASNRMVLIGPRGSTPHEFATLSTLDPQVKAAIGDPGFVPAGRYAQEVLEQVGAWAHLGGQLIYGGDVTRVLSYARRGEVDLAVVYETDVLDTNDLHILDRANWPGAPRPQIIAAATASGTNNDVAQSFLTFLGSPAARTLWREHGFVLAD